jgi:hypothetical protein
MTIPEVRIRTSSQGISREFPAPQQAGMRCTAPDIAPLDIIPYQVQSGEEKTTRQPTS